MANTENNELSKERLLRALDYQVGDIVQIRPDGKKHSGALGEIIGIGVYRTDKELDDLFYYTVMLSSKVGITVPRYRIRLVREAGSNTDLPESESKFIPLGQ